MFAALASPSSLMKREILAIAVSEAVRYGTTVRTVVESFFSGHERPALRMALERAEMAGGVPPAEMMALVGGFLDATMVEPDDLIVLLNGHQGAMPTWAQAKEITETAQRLARRARVHEKSVAAAQAKYDASVVPEPEMPQLSGRVAKRPIRASSVQRYSGLRS
jgi:hypothetical protein